VPDIEPTALPSTLPPFDWDVTRSGSRVYWTLSRALLSEQLARLATDHIAPLQRYGGEGSLWTPAVDLALGKPSGFTWFDEDRFVPARSVRAIAAGEHGARLRRGQVLRLQAVRRDPYHEARGTNFWSIDDSDIGVDFIHSALEEHWGGEALLADALIVPLGHSILGDPLRADRLVVDLQTITRAFRAANGLPADGWVASADPTSV
jgi:hypothetical protein